MPRAMSTSRDGTIRLDFRFMCDGLDFLGFKRIASTAFTKLKAHSCHLTKGAKRGVRCRVSRSLVGSLRPPAGGQVRSPGVYVENTKVRASNGCGGKARGSGDQGPEGADGSGRALSIECCVLLSSLRRKRHLSSSH